MAGSDDEAKRSSAPVARLRASCCTPAGAAACALASPIWLPLLFVLLLAASIYGVLGALLDAPGLFAVLSCAALGGLAAGTAAPITVWSAAVWDAAAAGAAAVAVIIVAARGGVRPLAAPAAVAAVSVAAAAAALAYAIAKGVLFAGGWTGAARAAVTLAALAPAALAVSVLGFWRWADARECAAAEARVLRAATAVDFSQYEAAGLHTVALGAGAMSMLELARGSGGGGGASAGAGAQPAAQAKVLVLLHGYMSGSALWMYNVEPFVAAGYRVFAVDWAGCAGSARVPFWPRTTAEAEDFFVEPLREWLDAHGVAAAVLVGHSLGGYLSAAFAERYPHRVAHLVLASPAGMAAMPAAPASAAPAAWRVPACAWATLGCCWRAGVTPGMGVRFAGPLAPAWLARAAKFRLARLALERTPSEDIVRSLSTYFYHSLASAPSGELALPLLLAPGAWALAAAGPRLAAAARAGGAKALCAPVTFLYGATNDWMQPAFALPVAAELRAAGVRAEVDSVSVPGGHHFYLESPSLFCARVLRAIDEAAAAAAGAGGAAAQPAS